SHALRHLLGQLALANPRWSGEEETSNRPFWIPQSRSRELDGGGQLGDCSVLSIDHRLELAFEVLQLNPVRGGDSLLRNFRHFADDALDIAHVHPALPVGKGPQSVARARLVDDIDGLVR